MVPGYPLRYSRDDKHWSNRERATRTPSQTRTTLTPLIPTKVGTQSIKGDLRNRPAHAAPDPGLRREERIFESAKQKRGRLSDRAKNQNPPQLAISETAPSRPGDKIPARPA